MKLNVEKLRFENYRKTGELVSQKELAIKLFPELNKSSAQQQLSQLKNGNVSVIKVDLLQNIVNLGLSVDEAFEKAGVEFDNKNEVVSLELLERIKDGGHQLNQIFNFLNLK